MTAADVRGLRVVFSNSDTTINQGYLLTPGSNLPASGICSNASVCYSVAARETLRRLSGATHEVVSGLAVTRAAAAIKLEGEVDARVPITRDEPLFRLREIRA